MTTWLISLSMIMLIMVGCDSREERPAPETPRVEDLPENESQEETSTSDERSVGNTSSAPKTQGEQLQPGTEEQEQLLVRAKSRLLEGDLDEAKSIFAQLSQTPPVSAHHVSASIALGDILHEQGEPREALKVYEALRERAPELAEVHLVLGRTQRDLGRRSDSIASYERALDIQPLYIFLLVEIGQLYSELDKAKESAETMLEYETKLREFATILRSPDASPLHDRLDVLEVFSMMQDDGVTHVLVDVVRNDPNSDVRAGAARALGQTRAVEAKETLEQVAQGDGADHVRAAAREALAALKGIKTSPPNSPSP